MNDLCSTSDLIWSGRVGDLLLRALREFISSDEDDWFDPILGADTRLFVDPFLIFRDEGPEWADAHEELIAYFNIAFHMVGNTMQSPTAPEHVKALDLLRFPEPRAFCLGYTDRALRGPVAARATPA